MDVKRIGAALATAAATAGLAACGSSSESSTTADAGAALVTEMAPASGQLDHLEWALPLGEPRTVDPSLGADFSPSFVSAQLCDTLVRLDDDFTISPNLASWEQADPRTLVYTLRSGVRFWNGRPLTADDVVYSLERSRRPEAITAQAFQSVTTIRATGPREVTVRFSRPDELFNKSMANFTGMVVERRFAERAGRRFGAPTTGVMCSGPFELASWRSGASIELTRNDAYWNPDFRAHARTVSLRFLSDTSALTQALLAGEVDGAYEIPPAALPALLRSDSGTLYSGRSLQYNYLAAADPDGPLADQALRSALFGSIDRAGIARVVYHGAAEPAYTQLPPNNWDPEALDQWRAAYGPFERAHQLSPEAAGRLVDGSPRKREEIVLAVPSGDATQSQVAQVIQQAARAIGLSVSVRAMQPTQFSEALVNPGARRGIDLLMSASFGAAADPVEQLEYMVLTRAFYNYTGYSDAQVDELLGRARAELDPAERTRLLVQAQSIYEPVQNATTVVTQNEILYLNAKLGGATTTFAYLFQPSLAKIGSKD